MLADYDDDRDEDDTHKELEIKGVRTQDTSRELQIKLETTIQFKRRIWPTWFSFSCQGKKTCGTLTVSQVKSEKKVRALLPYSFHSRFSSHIRPSVLFK